MPRRSKQKRNRKNDPGVTVERKQDKQHQKWLTQEDIHIFNELSAKQFNKSKQGTDLETKDERDIYYVLLWRIQQEQQQFLQKQISDFSDHFHQLKTLYYPYNSVKSIETYNNSERIKIKHYSRFFVPISKISLQKLYYYSLIKAAKVRVIEGSDRPLQYIHPRLCIGSVPIKATEFSKGDIFQIDDAPQRSVEKEYQSRKERASVKPLQAKESKLSPISFDPLISSTLYKCKCDACSPENDDSDDVKENYVSTVPNVACSTSTLTLFGKLQASLRLTTFRNFLMNPEINSEECLVRFPLHFPDASVHEPFIDDPFEIPFVIVDRHPLTNQLIPSQYPFSPDSSSVLECDALPFLPVHSPNRDNYTKARKDTSCSDSPVDQLSLLQEKLPAFARSHPILPFYSKVIFFDKPLQQHSVPVKEKVAKVFRWNIKSHIFGPKPSFCCFDPQTGQLQCDRQNPIGLNRISEMNHLSLHNYQKNCNDTKEGDKMKEDECTTSERQGSRDFSKMFKDLYSPLNSIIKTVPSIKQAITSYHDTADNQRRQNITEVDASSMTEATESTKEAETVLKKQKKQIINFIPGLVKFKPAEKQHEPQKSASTSPPSPSSSNITQKFDTQTLSIPPLVNYSRSTPTQSLTSIALPGQSMPTSLQSIPNPSTQSPLPSSGSLPPFFPALKQSSEFSSTFPVLSPLSTPFQRKLNDLSNSAIDFHSHETFFSSTSSFSSESPTLLPSNASQSTSDLSLQSLHTSSPPNTQQHFSQSIDSFTSTPPASNLHTLDITPKYGSEPYQSNTSLSSPFLSINPSILPPHLLTNSSPITNSSNNFSNASNLGGKNENSHSKPLSFDNEGFMNESENNKGPFAPEKSLQQQNMLITSQVQQSPKQEGEHQQQSSIEEPKATSASSAVISPWRISPPAPFSRPSDQFLKQMRSQLKENETKRLNADSSLSDKNSMISEKKEQSNEKGKIVLLTHNSKKIRIKDEHPTVKKELSQEKKKERQKPKRPSLRWDEDIISNHSFQLSNSISTAGMLETLKNDEQNAQSKLRKNLYNLRSLDSPQKMEQDTDNSMEMDILDQPATSPSKHQDSRIQREKKSGNEALPSQTLSQSDSHQEAVSKAEFSQARSKPTPSTPSLSRRSKGVQCNIMSWDMWQNVMKMVETFQSFSAFSSGKNLLVENAQNKKTELNSEATEEVDDESFGEDDVKSTEKVHFQSINETNEKEEVEKAMVNQSNLESSMQFSKKFHKRLGNLDFEEDEDEYDNESEYANSHPQKNSVSSSRIKRKVSQKSVPKIVPQLDGDIDSDDTESDEDVDRANDRDTQRSQTQPTHRISQDEPSTPSSSAFFYPTFYSDVEEKFDIQKEMRENKDIHKTEMQPTDFSVSSKNDNVQLADSSENTETDKRMPIEEDIKFDIRMDIDDESEKDDERTMHNQEDNEKESEIEEGEIESEEDDSFNYLGALLKKTNQLQSLSAYVQRQLTDIVPDSIRFVLDSPSLPHIRIKSKDQQVNSDRSDKPDKLDESDEPDDAEKSDESDKPETLSNNETIQIAKPRPSVPEEESSDDDESSLSTSSLSSSSSSSSITSPNSSSSSSSSSEPLFLKTRKQKNLAPQDSDQLQKQLSSSFSLFSPFSQPINQSSSIQSLLQKYMSNCNRVQSMANARTGLILPQRHSLLFDRKPSRSNAQDEASGSNKNQKEEVFESNPYLLPLNSDLETFLSKSNVTYHSVRLNEHHLLVRSRMAGVVERQVQSETHETENEDNFRREEQRKQMFGNQNTDGFIGASSEHSSQKLSTSFVPLEVEVKVEYGHDVNDVQKFIDSQNKQPTKSGSNNRSLAASSFSAHSSSKADPSSSKANTSPSLPSELLSPAQMSRLWMRSFFTGEASENGVAQVVHVDPVTNFVTESEEIRLTNLHPFTEFACKSSSTKQRPAFMPAKRVNRQMIPEEFFINSSATLTPEEQAKIPQMLASSASRATLSSFYPDEACWVAEGIFNALSYLPAGEYLLVRQKGQQELIVLAAVGDKETQASQEQTLPSSPSLPSCFNEPSKQSDSISSKVNPIMPVGSEWITSPAQSQFETNPLCYDLHASHCSSGSSDTRSQHFIHNKWNPQPMFSMLHTPIQSFPFTFPNDPRSK
ncbi:uncharacterized protein MONOS_2380 [Monocercomonoides exilis]|uniref:uncharacterized protein n=1 Tax=Monocercomonoides exilis TaxID=2049356 RepID=UPI003559D14A|nr:hypothetical protein MONOS_2380 [Monocercomonoides exilis]|eukprot:MONOS_2380.1-p1 / transcript=MONOS_2380.1 / gene=MONOS_2380 / organism=Monocercomonoides_exilis_PA203 / gene_product=unspecified product / transcript_product=unspecified product / location=Mono_scaffold00049:22629-29009(-) / protein_length=2127 / sequence_SO=supercontig / SO=protein_coding / is_pseudo=false